MNDAVYENLRASFYRTLTGRIIHSLSNLVSGIYGMAQLADTTGKEEYAEKTVEISVKNCKKIKEIIQKMAEYSGDLGKETSHADLREAAELAAALWDHDLEKYGVKIALSIPEKTTVSCAKGTVQEILALLVYNAMQAMEGGGRLIISVCAGENDAVALSFRLDAIPLTEEERHIIMNTTPSTETLPGRCAPWLLAKELVQREQGTFTIACSNDTAEILVSLPRRC